jgi:hypothetical protein
VRCLFATSGLATCRCFAPARHVGLSRFGSAWPCPVSLSPQTKKNINKNKKSGCAPLSCTRKQDGVYGSTLSCTGKQDSIYMYMRQAWIAMFVVLDSSCCSTFFSPCRLAVLSPSPRLPSAHKRTYVYTYTHMHTQTYLHTHTHAHPM